MLIGVVLKAFVLKTLYGFGDSTLFSLKDVEALWKHLYFYADSPYKAVSTISGDSFMTAVPNMTYCIWGPKTQTTLAELAVVFLETRLRVYFGVVPIDALVFFLSQTAIHLKASVRV